MFGAFQTFGKLGALASSVARAWSPLALWPDGISSAGMWISPRTLTSQRADYTGTTPVATPGTVADSSNPVGLVLDRKGNLELGPELVTNGDFSNGTTGWSGGASGTIEVLSGALRVSNVSGGYNRAAQNISAFSAGWLKISAALSGTDPLLTFLSSSGGGSGNTAVASCFYYHTGGTLTLQAYCHTASTGVWSDFDNISVREIHGISLSQATSTSRPVVSAKKNELVGTAALATQNVTSKALQYVLSFWGAGSVTLSGTSTAGPLAGTGAGDRVSLTFTPTAGTLTLTVSGTVTNAQLELGSVATTYQRVGATAADYDASAGPTFIRFDGVDDNLASATFPAGTLTSSMDCLIAVRRDSAANAVCGLYQSVAEANKVFGIAESGSGSGCVGSGAGTPTVLVDGTQLTGGTAVTRGTLHTALTPGDWHILEFRNLDLSTWTAVGFGLYTSYVLNGGYGGHKVFSNGQDANRDLARAEMAAYFGVTLP